MPQPSEQRALPVDPDRVPEPVESVRDRIDIVLAVALGGAIGATGRYELGHVLPPTAGQFPWGTFLVNVTGSLVLGSLLVLLTLRFPAHRYTRPFLGTGIIGAYTTFSTYMVEADTLARDGHWWLAAGYVTVSLAAGLLAVRTGMGIGRAFAPRTVRVR